MYRPFIRNLLFWTALLVPLLALSGCTVLAGPSVASRATYPVVSVVDGDTLKVSIDGKTETVRIIGINTPESVDPRRAVQCFGVEASNKAKSLLSGQRVVLEADPSQGDRDEYGRLLRYVDLADGTDFGLAMIEQGYAHEYTYDTPYARRSVYRVAYARAREAGVGLWSPDTCNGNTK